MPVIGRLTQPLTGPTEIPPFEAARIEFALLGQISPQQTDGPAKIAVVDRLLRQAHIGGIAALLRFALAALSERPLLVGDALILHGQSASPFGLAPFPNDANETEQHGQGYRGCQSGDERIPPAPAPRAFGFAHGPGQHRFAGQKASQVGVELFGGVIAPCGVFLEALQHDGVEIARDRRIMMAHRLRILELNPLHQFGRRHLLGRPMERPQGEQFPQRRPQTINIAAGINSTGRHHLLGARVAERADELAGPRQPPIYVVVQLSQPEVHQHDLRPECVSMILPGLMSRWITPAACNA